MRSAANMAEFNATLQGDGTREQLATYRLLVLLMTYVQRDGFNSRARSLSARVTDDDQARIRKLLDKKAIGAGGCCYR